MEISASTLVNDLPVDPRPKWDRRYAALAADAQLKPTPFVVECLPYLPPAGRALDIAAGAGRHTLALARHGLHVDAVDISWRGLRLAQQRAAAADLSGQIQCIVADIERPWLPHSRYEVILVSLFLYRPLWPLIKMRLRAGSWLIYETFTGVQQVNGAGVGPSCQDHLLQPDELRQVFADFELYIYRETERNQRTTAQLLARKPTVGPR